MNAISKVSLFFAVSIMLRAAEPSGPSSTLAPPAGLAPAKTADKLPPMVAVSARTNAPAIGMYNEHDTLLAYQIASANKGFAQSQYIMALRYLTGNGVPKNEAKAREYLEAASKKGHMKSREKLRQLNLAEAAKKAAAAVP